MHDSVYKNVFALILSLFVSSRYFVVVSCLGHGRRAERWFGADAAVYSFFVHANSLGISGPHVGIR